MKIKWFRILIYVSLVFLVVMLIRSDYLVIPEIVNLPALFISVVLLFGAFFVLCYRWFVLLKRIKLPVRLTDAIVSVGLAIFAKYIPGKLLMVIGKVGHIKENYEYRNDVLLTASFNDQLLAIWTGLLVGILSFLYIQSILLLLITLGIWFVFSLSIFTNLFHIFLRNMIQRFTKREFNIEIIRIGDALFIMPWYILYWLLVGTGFFFLFQSVYDSRLPLFVISVFPLSVVIGIVSIISPGGIGVREAVLAAFFISQFNTEVSVTMSGISRIWFLCGEFTLFAFALFIHFVSRKKFRHRK